VSIPWLRTCCFATLVWSTPDLPQGRITPYVDIGIGAQRAVLSLQFTSHREVDYAPPGQLLVGMKVFVLKNSLSSVSTSGSGPLMKSRTQTSLSPLDALKDMLL